MFDSLPYRNDAATVFRRLIRSLPTRRGVLGVATCDKGLPAMMMALAASHDLPCVLVPGGVTLPAGRSRGRGARADDRRPLRARRHHAGGGGRPRVPRLRVAGRRLPVPRHRRDVPGRRRGAGHVAWPLRARAFRPADLARHGAAFGTRADGARGARHPHPRHRHRRRAPQRDGRRTPRSADRPTCSCTCRRSPTRPGCRGRPRATGPRSTAACRASSTRCRTVRATIPTVQVFLAGGVPEVMLHLRRAGLLDTSRPDGDRRDAGRTARRWEASERRTLLRQRLRDARRRRPGRRDSVAGGGVEARADLDGVLAAREHRAGRRGDQEHFHRSVRRGRRRRLSHYAGRRGSLSPSRPPSRRSRAGQIKPGDVLVLICRGPMGAGMEETYQLTSALKYLDFGKHVALAHRRALQRRVDRRLHRTRLAGGARRRTDRQAARRRPDRNRDRPDPARRHGQLRRRRRPCGRSGRGRGDPRRRPPRPDLAPDAQLPAETRLWAALQDASGGTWGGSVFDVDAILELLAAGKKALKG